MSRNAPDARAVRESESSGGDWYACECGCECECQCYVMGCKEQRGEEPSLKVSIQNQAQGREMGAGSRTMEPWGKPPPKDMSSAGSAGSAGSAAQAVAVAVAVAVAGADLDAGRTFPSITKAFGVIKSLLLNACQHKSILQDTDAPYPSLEHTGRLGGWGIPTWPSSTFCR